MCTSPIKERGFRLLLVTALLSCIPLLSFAAADPGAETLNPDDLLRYTLAGVMLLFLCVIAILGSAVRSAGRIYWQRQWEEKQRKGGSAGTAAILVAVLLLSGSGAFAQAQPEATAVAAPAYQMPSDIAVILIIIALELLIILLLSRMLLRFLKVERAHRTRRKIQWSLLFQRLNQTVAVTEEQQLDLQHNYDGIRELDNRVPVWWRYGFYLSMLFGVIYLYRMFVSGSLPDQIRELQQENRLAAIRKEEYLKNAANNVDEHNVVMLGAEDIAGGSLLFSKNCQSCHGDKGQGGVGPNLTDEYWLHKGGISDIFRSIKYGWQEKGMKSWKDDFSPAQIAQLASFVKSLKGTNPPAPKEPQGELFQDGAAAADTTKIKS